MSRRPSRMPFVKFCEAVLRLSFTAPWRVLLKVAIDGVQPRELEGEEREHARKLFGDVDEIDPRLRRILVWRLGRGSGKSTVAAALAIYGAWTCDLSRVGRGHVPAAFVVSPTKALAKIVLGIARELVRGTELEAYVLDDTSTSFTIRRPDGRLVEILSVAASKGGANLRGRDVVVLVLDESEFFASNEDTAAEGYAITDRDQIAAVMPRLIGFVLCISTPWPTENVTAEYYDRNWGKPQDAVAALGTSMYMRPSEQLAQDIAREMVRSEEDALREYECIPGTRGGSRLFDIDSLRAAIVENRPLTIRAPSDVLRAAGGDLGLERDSSAIAFASRLPDGRHDLLEYDEIRPAKGAPLSPGYVLRDRFAPLMRAHQTNVITMDAHYRQSAIEHLTAVGLLMLDAPPGIDGKYSTYMHVRGLLRAGLLSLPNAPRLLAQFRAVTATPLPGGKTRITTPRRAGSGHGDVLSAVVLALWALRETAMQGQAFQRRVAGFHSDMAATGQYGHEAQAEELGRRSVDPILDAALPPILQAAVRRQRAGLPLGRLSDDEVAAWNRKLGKG